VLVIEAKTSHTNVTGINFLCYAKRYQDAAGAVKESQNSQIGLDIVPFQLASQSLELLLKSYIWYSDDIGTQKIRKKYGHDIVKLWNHAKSKGIVEHLNSVEHRDSVISIIGKYYKDKQLCYLDLEMIHEGYEELKALPESLNILCELNNELLVVLKPLMFEASRRGN
jgi:hypothetical protein